jgi:acyl-CoA carboxylase subunit beta
MMAWGPRLVSEWDADLRGGDPLGFPGYSRTLKEAEAESVSTGLAELDGCQTVLIQTHFDRFGGTMGAVAGEKVARAFDRAAASSLPVLAITATGGARLQEGMIALVQMARTVAARARHAAAGQLMVAVYDSPTTGGVYASWASLADVRAAISGATIGFGGPRVVEQVTGQWPPLTSHTAEAAYDAGLVDRVLRPGTETDWLRGVLGRGEQPLALEPRRPHVGEYPGAGDLSGGWATVQAARSLARPSGLEWAAALTTSWTDLHGPASVFRAGLARIGGRQAVVVAMDRHARADGAAHPGPDDYRLAQRAIRLASQLRLPLITLVDTPGADPGPRSEAGGIAGEIARTLGMMVEFPGVSVSACVGEGGSGGAMALGHADRVFMLAGSVFSVIGPEAAAAVLDRDAGHAPRMADALGITGADLLRLGVVDGLLPDAGPAALGVIRTAVLDAIDTARPGDRATRTDRATQPWLRHQPKDG